MTHVATRHPVVAAEARLGDGLHFDTRLPAIERAFEFEFERAAPRDMPAPRSKPLREAMPEVAGFIDALRDAFGRDSVDPSLARGLAGEPMFYASEGGSEVGTRSPSDPWRAIGVRDRYYCEGCNGTCAGTQTQCTGSTLDKRDAYAGVGSAF